MEGTMTSLWTFCWYRRQKQRILLVADDDLSYEDNLEGFPVLHQPGIAVWESLTLLKRNCTTIDGKDCSNVIHFFVPNSCISIDHLMTTRLQRVNGREPTIDDIVQHSVLIDQHRQLGNYYAHTFDDHPFSDPKCIGLDDASREEVHCSDITDMLIRARERFFP